MRTKFLPLLLLLAALMPRAALAQKTHIASTSSSTTMTWDEFANNVTGGILYNNMTVYLDEDITVTTCAGDPWDRSFRGTFDGQGHTLTFNGDATYSWYAPFTSADGATFKNLKVTGTINSSNGHDFCAGFVGSIHTNNTCTFINCESNISINTDRYFHGGFVGNIQGGTTYFYGCTFTGRMFTFDDSSACSGFVGYCESSNYTAKVFFYDCIFDPSDINFSSQCFTFVRGNEANTYFSNCYYTRTYDWAEQGKQAYTITASSPITVALNGTATNYNVSHITAYSDNNGLVYNNTLLAGSGDQVSLNLYNSSAPYSVNYGTLSGTANPYTLTMEANNTVIALDTYVCHEDFEHDCDWTLVNGDLTNQWYWGEAAHNGEGTHGLYISNDSGTTNAYTATNPSMVYVYKTFTFETDVYKFSYDWLANGESTYDYLRVALVPASVTLTASTDKPSDFDVDALPEGWIALDGSSKLNQVTIWQTMSQEINITAGTYKMVFAWSNDNSVGNNPPAAIDNVSIERIPYPRPDNLRCTSFGATTATLAWTENGEATAWQICLNDDETNLINVTENPYTLTNLTAGTTYTVKVRASNENGQSEWSNSISFNTAQIPAGIPYSTNFETDCDWIFINGSLTNQWVWGTAASHGEGTHGLYISNDGGTTNDYDKISSTMVYASKLFAFEPGIYKFSYDWLANGESNFDYLRVALVPANVFLEAGTTAPTVPSGSFYSNLPTGWRALDGGRQLKLSTEWQTMNAEVELPTAGNYMMVFAWRNDSSGGTNPPAAIDNVSIDAITCPMPNNMRCTAFNAHTATLAWTENGEASAWQICLNDDETNLIDVTENPYTLTNLTSETSYSVKVRANCGDKQSSWSNSANFTTTEACPTPTDFAATEIYGYGATLSWTGTSQSYSVMYRTADDVDGHNERFDGTNIPSGWENKFGLLSNVMGGTALTTGSQWNFGTSNGVFNEHARINIYGDNPCCGWLVTPQIQVPEGSVLNFNLALTAYSGTLVDPETDGVDDKFVVLISTDDEATWTILRQWDNAEGSTYVYNDINSTATGVQVSIDLASYAGQSVRIAFYGESTVSNADNNLHIDNVGIGIPIAAGVWKTVTVDEASVVLTDLIPETLYEAKLQGNCGDEGLSHEVFLSFSTLDPCPVPTGFAATEIYGHSATLNWRGYSESYTISYRTAAHMDGHNERFDGTNIPSGWENKHGLLSNVMEGTALTTGSQWNFSTSNGVFNEHARINIYGNNPCCGWLVTPQIQLPEGSVLNFDLALTAYSGTLVDPATDGVDDKFVVLISTDDEATWTILRQWDNAEGSTYVYNDINSTATGVQVSIDLASYAGQSVRIAFYGESTVSNADNNLHIDNVGIGIPIAAGVWKTVTVDEASAILTDLIPETLYEAKLQGNCGDDGLSLETSLSFSTIVACPGPTNLTAVDSLLAATTAGLSWHDSPDVDNYTVKYRTTSALFFEDFEGGIMPSDWTQSGPGTWDVTEGYGHNNIGTHSGTYNAIINHTTKEYETFLITPMLDLSGQNDLSLTFWYINYNWGSSDIDQLYVYYRVNEGEWIELWNTTEDHQVWTESGAITLPNPSANYQIGFKMIDKYGHGVGIDDIIIGTDVPAGEWQTASVPGGTAQVSTTLTSLSPETIYEAYVYPDCDPDMVSETVYFKTAQAPDNLFYWTDFETDGDWTFINSDYNKWFWGTAASDNDNHTLYISWTSNGSSYTYFGMSCMVYATKTFEFEEGAYNFSFDWKANGITKSAFLRAALVPSSVTLESTESALPGFNFYSLPSGWIAIDGSWQLNQSTEWQTSSNEVMVPSGTYMLAFIWFNNYLNENNPPAAVDNLVITRVAYPKPSDMQCTTLTPTTATLDWTENGTATAWQICINDNEDNLINVTQNSYTLSNLITETVYSAKVRAQYDTNYSDWSNTVVFTPTDKTVIGSGNTNAYYLPVSKEDSYGLTQQIYTASEIDGAGPIESIAFFKNDTIECNRNVEIYLRHTDKTTFENEYDWINIPGNPNFNGTVDFVDYGWTTINLSNPFVYDGTSNLVVVVYDKTNSGSSNDIVHFLSYEAPGQAIRSNYYNAIYGIHNLDISSNQRPFVEKVKNHIRFDKLNCARPSNIYVSKILHTSAYVYWTGESDSYTVIYTDLTNDETHTITTTTNSVTLTDLTIATQYELIVIPSCDENAVSNTITFTTKTNDFKVFVTDGDWDDPNNWEPMGVPTFDQVTAINANVTINRVVEINDISLINGSITIEDGGQLKYNTNSMTGQITVTMKKNITGYGTGEGKYYLLAWPFTNETSPSNVTNMLDDGSEDHEYDLYSWLRNPSDSLEWRNYKQTPFNLSRTNGYLYASKNSVELSFTGTLHLGAPYHVGFPPYDNSCRFGSWTVYGNPFLGDVYLTTSTSGGSSLPYYRLNEGGDALMAVASGPIAPLEGIFYKSSSNGPVFITKSTPTSRGSFLNINLSQGNSLKSNTIVRFDGGETLDKFMLREDGSKLSIPQDGKDYAVVSADHEGELPLSFKAETDGTYTLSFSCEEVEFSYLHLIDNLTGEDIDLMVTKPVEVPACYTFDARTTDNENRFKLVFITK